MSEVKCPWCGVVNNCFDELFRHDEEQVETECNFCGKNMTIVQNIVINYEAFRAGHDEEGAEAYRNNLCGNCYNDIDKPFYRCAICGNAVCVPCREKIKTRYPECYANMSLVILSSTQEEKKG